MKPAVEETKTESTKVKLLSKFLSFLLRAYCKAPEHTMKQRFLEPILKMTKEKRAVVRYAKGGWISLDCKDYLQSKIFKTGNYEPEVWEQQSKWASSNEIVWDVGAHIGSFSIKVGLDERIKCVHAFEPNPNTYGILVQNIALNSCDIHPHNIALSASNQQLELNDLESSNSGMATLSQVASIRPQAKFKVNCRSVDDLILNRIAPAPTLMKIDVEGWELNVFKGANSLLSSGKLKAIVFESRPGPRGELADENIKALLESKGYRIEHIARPEGQEVFENYVAYLSR